MARLLDQLFTGTASRRQFLERLSAAGAGATLVAGAFPDAVAECRTQVRPPRDWNQEGVSYSPANIGGGGRVERNFYRDWLKQSQIPVTEGYSIYDAKNQEVQPWPEIGGRGLYLNFSGNVHMDGVIIEIPEGKALVPQRHCYEQLICVLRGRGRTTVGEGSNVCELEWGEGALFSVPLNAQHRHFNADAAHPARLLVVTTFPLMIQMFGSIGMIEDMDFDFEDRYDGSPDYYTRDERIHQRWWRSNAVWNMRTSELVTWDERGRGNASRFWSMAGNTILEPHVSQFPMGTYKLGHRHPYEAIILTLDGKGFSLAGHEGLAEANEPVKLDWKDGSVVSPPYYWYHQHFNTGQTKARYFAITEGDFPKRLGVPLEVQQIEADQEDPSIRRRFEQELGRTRVGKTLANPGIVHG